MWNNERILKFIALFRDNPSLWNPRDHNYSKRAENKKCWESICLELDTGICVGGLKRKKESLMASYRWHKKKMQVFPKYKPAWFAFNLMDSFLDGRYSAINDVTVEFLEDEYFTNASDQFDPIGTESGEKTTSPGGSRQSNNFLPLKRVSEMDDCELYGQLLVTKLKKLDETQRDIVINKIDNLMFQAKMNKCEVEIPSEP